ncbi:glycosyltransferase family 4 protein [Halobacterium salinarum]|uniref:glycosyltransferase family 4 protein n=1 Tax=Halobacterium salinarum TaxID=2242 RepID=UPI0030D08539
MDLSKKHILHIITRSEWGGAPRVVNMLAKHSNPDTSVACGSGGRLISELREANVPVHELPQLESAPSPISDIRTLVQLCYLLNTKDFDLIHCHSTKAGLIGRLAGTITQTPTLFTVHGWGFYNTEYDKLSSAIIHGERFLAQITDAIVCVSENDLRQGDQHNITQNAMTKVIHNGVPPIEFDDDRTQISDICSITNDKPVLGAIVRLAPQKNPKAILRAGKKLQDRGRAVQVVIIGSGPLMAECEDYISKHNLDSVFLLGFQENALELLPDIDIFLLPSRFEGFPLTVLESLHAGVPIVAYDVGGVSEAVQEGCTGYVCAEGDHNQFVDNIEKIIKGDKSSFMGSNARTIARERFSAQRMSNDYEDVYKQILRDD